MAIDPNIIAGLRPPQIPVQDPLEQYSKSLALKGLLGQQDLQALQLQSARQGADDEQAQRAALIESGGDNKRYRELLANRGQYKAVQGFDKFNLDTAEKQSVIDKNRQEITAKAVAQHRDA